MTTMDLFRLLRLAVFILITSSSPVIALQGRREPALPKVVCVESWKKGKKQIGERLLNITLSAEQNSYETIIQDQSGRDSYKLILLRYPAGKEDYNLQYLVVRLQEILPETGNTKDELRGNLLTMQAQGTGGDFFPQQDLVGFLYPNETPNRLFVQFYPIYTKRIIKVESFFVVLQVSDFQMNSKNNKLLDRININIEFKNEAQEDCPASKM